MTFKERIIKEFNLSNPTAKGWYTGDCPLCGKEEHLGVVFGKVSSFRCVKCNQKGTLNRLLKLIGRTDLLDNTSFLNIKKVEIVEKFKVEKTFTISGKNLPIGFTRIYSDDYLNDRGFTNEDYLRYPVGISDIERRYKNYIIFPILEKDDTCSGFISRIKLDSNELKSINIKRKRAKFPILRRYQNSFNTDFGKLFYGIREIIIGKTKTVILVEGFFKKKNIDTLMGLYNNDKIKCLATFGKHLTLFQVERLKELGIKKIIIIFDPDAILETQELSFKYENSFEIKIGFAKRDPDKINKKELDEIFENLESPFKFKISKVQVKEFK